MVSLTNNSQSGSYFGFSDSQPVLSARSDGDHDLIVDHIELVAGPEVVPRPIGTTWAIVLAKILYVGLGVAAHVLPIVCPDKTCGEDPLALILYIHGAMWFAMLVLHRYFQHKHTQSRLQGYLEFYRRTKNIRGLPFMVNSCANALLVIVNQILNHCHDSGDCVYLSKKVYVQILISIECVLALIILLVYLVRTCQFNRRKALPDVTQEELMTSFVNSTSDVGYRSASHLDQVMEKQADMIRFLRQHGENLARRNLAMAEELARLKAMRREGSVHGQF